MGTCYEIISKKIANIHMNMTLIEKYGMKNTLHKEDFYEKRYSMYNGSFIYC